MNECVNLNGLWFLFCRVNKLDLKVVMTKYLQHAITSPSTCWSISASLRFRNGRESAHGYRVSLSAIIFHPTITVNMDYLAHSRFNLLK